MFWEWLVAHMAKIAAITYPYCMKQILLISKHMFMAIALLFVILALHAYIYTYKKKIKYPKNIIHCII